MLTRIQFANYRCFTSMDVPLRPLTVLIGANDTGKSVFLRGLAHFVNGGRLAQEDHWPHDPSTPAEIHGWITEGKATLNRDQKREPLQSYAPAAFFQLPSQGVPMISEGQSDEGNPPTIGEDGGNIATLLDFLLRRDRKRFFAIVDVLRKLAPGLQEIEIATPHPSKRRLDLVIENGFRIQAQNASAGLRLLIFFVALAYHPVPPKLVLLEEPENGIHPKRLKEVVELLRFLTESGHGYHPVQVVVTTHSPYLLDFIDVTKDQVLVFRREQDGSRVAEPADSERMKVFLDEFMLGEVWYNEGEKGLVANRP